MHTWHHRTLIAPNWMLNQLQEKEWSDNSLGNIVELDRQGETEIGTALHDLGSDSWELAAALLVQVIGEYPSPELLMIFKRPTE